MKRTVIVQRTGESSTGTPHGLLIEDDKDGIRFTVVGADGQKRHAAVILPDLATATMVEALAGHLKTNERWRMA